LWTSSLRTILMTVRQMGTRWAVGCVYLSLISICCSARNCHAGTPYEVDWSRSIQNGESSNRAVDVDSAGNVYVSGFSTGDVAQPNAGGSDAYLVKYDAAGALLWSRQQGTTANEGSNGVAVDSLGNVYTTGWTRGALAGASFGDLDAFLFKYNGAGDLIWSRQLGTSTIDQSWSMTVDGAENIYVVGDTFGSLGGMNGGHNDAFVVKYDSGGNQQWARQFGTNAHDSGYDVAADSSGNVFVVGGSETGGIPEGFLVKYDSAGNKLWHLFSTIPGWDESFAVATDANGNTLVTGRMPGADGFDTSVAKYDTNGNLLWLRSSGASGDDEGRSVVTDELGNAYITGVWGYRSFLTKYDPDGNAEWFAGLDNIPPSHGFSVAIDGNSNLLVAGDGGLDYGAAAVVTKLSPIPEPASDLLLAGGLLLIPLLTRPRG
jgi:hypothetical protein